MTKSKSPRVTLQDVGRSVGVSAKTVSNVINQTGAVSDTVRLKVLEAINSLGYRPNLAARQLRGGQSGLIALIVPTLREPYFAEFAASFVAAAGQRNLTVLVSQTDGVRSKELAAIEGHSLPGLDAIVLSPLALSPSDLDKRESTTPLIIIGEHGQHIAESRAIHVGVDNIAAARSATNQLIENSCRRIAVIGVQPSGDHQTSSLRFAGYLEALESAHIDFDPTLVGTVDKFNRLEGSEAARTLITSGVNFDGLFCFSDSLAFGALHSLTTAKIAVPEQVRVIGFDNIEEGRFSLPPFDTVDPGADEGSNIILDILASTSFTPRHVTVPYIVVERSTPQIGKSAGSPEYT